MLNFIFSEEEFKEIEKTIIIIIDTREKQKHVIEYLERQKILYIRRKLDVGDYSAYIPKNEKLGIMRDLYLPVVIERKNGLDELANNFCGTDRMRFENEFMRASAIGIKIYLLVEDGDGFNNICKNKYRVKIKANAFVGSLKDFEARYDFVTVFVNKEHSPYWIYSTLCSLVKEHLKQLVVS